MGGAPKIRHPRASAACLLQCNVHCMYTNKSIIRNAFFIFFRGGGSAGGSAPYTGAWCLPHNRSNQPMRFGGTQNAPTGVGRAPPQHGNSPLWEIQTFINKLKNFSGIRRRGGLRPLKRESGGETHLYQPHFLSVSACQTSPYTSPKRRHGATARNTWPRRAAGEPRARDLVRHGQTYSWCSFAGNGKPGNRETARRETAPKLRLSVSDLVEWPRAAARRRHWRATPRPARTRRPRPPAGRAASHQPRSGGVPLRRARHG